MHFSVVKNISPESCYLTFGSFFCLTIGKETLLLHSRLLTHECGVEADDFYFIFFFAPILFTSQQSPTVADCGYSADHTLGAGSTSHSRSHTSSPIMTSSL